MRIPRITEEKNGTNQIKILVFQRGKYQNNEEIIHP